MEELVLVLGSEDPFSDDLKKQGLDFTIKDFVKHPEFKQSEVYFDIAILQLDRTVEMSFEIHPICIPKKANYDIDSMKGLPAWISGYGSETGKSSSVIHYAPLIVLGHEDCEDKHYDELEKSESEIDQALRKNVNLIFDAEKKISNEILCTKASIEELGTCPGGCKIDDSCKTLICLSVFLLF